VKQFTIGYIRHNKYVYETYLGPSIDNLEGDFDVLSTTDENKPAANYNELISKCNTPYLILTHQDVTFSPNLLDRLKMTIKETPITLGYDEVYKNSKSFLNHHSYTLSKRGSCWGRYGEYRQKLSQKWPGICTT